MAAGFGIFGLIWLTIMLATVGGVIAAIWAFVDMIQKPEWAWPYAGENRTMYIALLAGSFFVCQPLAWIPAIMYFKAAKPRLMAVLATVPAPVPAYPTFAPLGYGPPPGYGPPGYGPPPQPWQAQQQTWAPQPQPQPQGTPQWQTPGYAPDAAAPTEQANPTAQPPDYPSSGPVGE